MDKGSHDKFLSNLLLISEEKKRNPKLKLRINYTFNKDNFLELENFFEVFKDVSIDILQLRPIQKIGNTEYHDFNLDSLHEAYIPLLEKIRSIAKERKVTLLSTHLLRSNPSSDQNYLVPYTYCYVSPKHCWKDNFNFREETFAQWSRRVHWKSGIFSAILRNKEVTDKDTGTEKLNYSVDIN
jgi:sulfatase maturation enzyme AslB (radical SAM superfamily)